MGKMSINPTTGTPVATTVWLSGKQDMFSTTSDPDVANNVINAKGLTAAGSVTTGNAQSTGAPVSGNSGRSIGTSTTGTTGRLKMRRSRDTSARGSTSGRNIV